MNTYVSKLKVFYFLLFFFIITVTGEFNIVIASTIDNQTLEKPIKKNNNPATNEMPNNKTVIVISGNTNSNIDPLITSNKVNGRSELEFDLSNPKEINASRNQQLITPELDNKLLEILGISINQTSFLGYNNELLQIDSNNLWITLNNSVCHHLTKVLSALAKGICEENPANNGKKQFDSQLAFMLTFLKRL